MILAEMPVAVEYRRYTFAFWPAVGNIFTGSGFQTVLGSDVQHCVNC